MLITDLRLFSYNNAKLWFSHDVAHITASKKKKELNHLRTVIEGSHGTKGSNRDCDGKNADHLYIQVCSTEFLAYLSRRLTR